MIGSITEVQEQLAAIEKRRKDRPDSTDRGSDDMAKASMEPEGFRRGYIEPGHAAQSPQAEPPRTNPMPQLVPGFPMAVALPGAAMAAHVSQEIASTLCGGSPSER